MIIGACLFGLVVPRPTQAHQVGLSRGVYTVDGREIAAEVTFARGELRGLAPGLDADGDGLLGDDELAGGGAALAAVVAGIEVTGDAQACPGSLVRAGLTEEDGAVMAVRHVCAAPPRELVLRWSLFEGGKLAAGHRHIAEFVAPGAGPEDILAEGVLHARAPAATVPLDGAAGERQGWPVTAYFELGVEHILIGTDHLVFLLGLVVVGGRLRSLVAVITAFTLGHSLSLALATLEIWTPDGSWVEPAIALSIAYVGLENFFVADAAGRWRITLPFGFIHGFGFAGVLAELGLPAGEVGPALLLFNLGVEAGQLAVLALVLPVLLWLGRLPAYRKGRGARWISGAIVIAGLAWFVERVFGG
ncbi:HupE/UreJ family protein [Nannocystis pusilla]|uniref:HupE/UreJ family protein n=1 Tax=Nannocystis pusilla TaxID=889268 RepID=A0ABS7TZT8_9BACT|nr:HupE/UreJ family protein [Nannocystis pusilla]MBZ5713788.1 HupE/UreJ family protein [Nannocystis pusilla]